MGQFAYVFAGRNGLDLSQVRNHVLRIPEVSLRVREAQSILDSLEVPRASLIHHISSDDETYLRDIQMKSLSAAIVQVGLFDRLRKSPGRRPEILVGTVNGDSALATVIGRQSFADMIRRSAAVDTQKPSPVLVELLSLVSAVSPAPLLSGVELSEFEAVAFNAETQKFETIQSGQMDSQKLLRALVESRGVRGFVNIGPSGLVSRDVWDLEEIEVVDSIELDPMLSWFWTAIRPEPQSLAN